MASALNSLSAVTMEDFIEGALKFKVPRSKGALWAKSISIAYGAISFALVCLNQYSFFKMNYFLTFVGFHCG